jgi:hypothetical protein
MIGTEWRGEEQVSYLLKDLDPHDPSRPRPPVDSTRSSLSLNLTSSTINAVAAAVALVLGIDSFRTQQDRRPVASPSFVPDRAVATLDISKALLELRNLDE